jgi:hypothetical protein
MTFGTKKPPHPETVREHGSSKLEPPQEAEPAPEPAELKAPAEPTAAEVGVCQILKDLLTTLLLYAGWGSYLSNQIVVQIDQKNRGSYGPQLAIFMSDSIGVLGDLCTSCRRQRIRG